MMSLFLRFNPQSHSERRKHTTVTTTEKQTSFRNKVKEKRIKNQNYGTVKKEWNKII
jgi:hypothetical protein